MVCDEPLPVYKIVPKCLLGSFIVGSGKFAEHNAKCPVGGAYLKSPMPLASVFPPDVSCP